ncbi:MAG: glycosyltransferase [Ferruginibacter sp.]
MGISVIICCYNSVRRIQKTLEALLKQECISKISWEVIIVDNNSTDNTSAIASAIWVNSGTRIPLNIIEEPIPGLGNARRAGVSVANHPILIFCDDDNWLAPNYVQRVYELMHADNSIAACGGMGIPVFETEEPYWFYMYAEAFALGPQDVNSETEGIFDLYGAGIAVQKEAIQTFYQSGYEPLLSGRVGKSLSSSEDTELTNAFVLMGYKLIFSEDLKFFHYLPKDRLTFSYLQQLFIAFGTDGPVRNLYYANLSKRFFHNRVKSWSFHLLLSLVRLVKYLLYPPKKYGRTVYFNWGMAYIKQLFVIRKDYRKLNERIASLKHIGNNISGKTIQAVRSLSVENKNGGIF